MPDTVCSFYVLILRTGFKNAFDFPYRLVLHTGIVFKDHSWGRHCPFWTEFGEF